MPVKGSPASFQLFNSRVFLYTISHSDYILPIVMNQHSLFSAAGPFQQGYRGGAKRFGRLLKYSAKAGGTIGPVPAFQWLVGTAQNNLGIPKPQFHNIRPPFLDYSVKLRARTSDCFVFRQIMIENEYQALKSLSVATILDLGANIGLSSAWFLSSFPEAHLFAVEAATENLPTCRQNLAPYGKRARLLHGAAWSHRTTLTLHRKSCAADNWVEESTNCDTDTKQVQAWDVPSLIEMSGFAKIDLLKIDIEGSESEIFRHDVSSWLGRVRNLCIELHGEACRKIFFQALASYDYRHTRSGEVDICTDLKLKTAV